MSWTAPQQSEETLVDGNDPRSQWAWPADWISSVPFALGSSWSHATGQIFPSILDALGFVLPWMNSSQHSRCPCDTGLCERCSVSSGRNYPFPPLSDFCLQCHSGVFPLCLFPLGLFCPFPTFVLVALYRLHLPPTPVQLCYLMKLME